MEGWGGGGGRNIVTSQNSLRVPPQVIFQETFSQDGDVHSDQPLCSSGDMMCRSHGLDEERAAIVHLQAIKPYIACACWQTTLRLRCCSETADDANTARKTPSDVCHLPAFCKAPCVSVLLGMEALYQGVGHILSVLFLGRLQSWPCKSCNAPLPVMRNPDIMRARRGESAKLAPAREQLFRTVRPEALIGLYEVSAAPTSGACGTALPLCLDRRDAAAEAVPSFDRMALVGSAGAPGEIWSLGC